MAEREALTQLLTKETFDSEFPHSLAEAAKANRPLSLVFIDIDHFKQVNDTHGHQMGDAVLAGVAACIATTAEGKGRVYRYGGEEIVVVLPNHSVLEATAVAERVRRELESARISGLAITASFGVGTFPDHGRSDTEIISAADKAMYDAKNRGRNLVRVFGEPAPLPDKPREPERKIPTPGALTEQQKQKLKMQHFRGYQISCPNDGAILTVREITHVGSPTASLLVWCKLCGLQEQF